MPQISIERTERQLFSLKSKEEILKFIRENETYSNYFLNRMQFPNDSVFVESLSKLLSDPYIDTLYNDVQNHFGELDWLESDLETAFSKFKYYLPNFEVPEIKTGITGFASDLYVSDSLVIIGLDFFLGRLGTYRPQGYPAYIVNRFEKEYIVPNIVLHLTKFYNQLDPRDNSFLADMIFYGKSYYLTDRILPCTPDTLIIQYSSKELNDVRENEPIIWAHFIENDLIYETNHFLKRKYLEERPNVPEIGSACPGRVGAWVGWQIVEDFQEYRGLNVPELMKTDDANRIFSESKYRPEN
jgi:hypothetical protein